jgi:CheY-like chemotaxis protein
MARRVLVVDDDPDFIELIHSVLQLDGYEVVGCTNSTLALEMVRRLRPALVFLDLQMPRPSGWEVLQALRQDPAFASIPVLVISALDAEPSETEALAESKLQPLGVLTKPFEIDELTQQVNRLLHQLADASGGLAPDERRTTMCVQPTHGLLKDTLHP